MFVFAAQMEAAGLTEKVVEDHIFNFSFPSCERLSPPVLVFQKVGFSYDGKIENALYRGVEVGVDMDSRIALVGPNGAGKSTLLKLIMQEIQPTEGEIRKHLHVQLGRYNQHSNDQLDQTATPLDYFRSVFADEKMEEQDWRSYLGRFGISGPMQKTPIGNLSDGQKSRVGKED